MTMTHASLFSGIGGFDLAAEWAVWMNVFNCEIDPFCQKVLKYHFPHAEQYADIRTTDFTLWRGRIDVLTGGFPCQPFSLAGKRKGQEDDRYLWPEMLQVIRTVRPRWVVGENVYGIVNWSDGMVFEQVCADLETAGYEVQPYVIPACGVGAPHRRDRCWFVAHAKNTQRVRCDGDKSEEESEAGGFGKSRARDHVWICGEKGAAGLAANTARFGRNKRWSTCDRAIQNAGVGPNLYVSAERSGRKRPASDTQGERLPVAGRTRREQAGRIPDWSNFPTQSPVRRRDDGFSAELDGITFPRWRRESIKAYGNAIVPQVALQIFETINEYEKL